MKTALFVLLVVFPFFTCCVKQKSDVQILNLYDLEKQHQSWKEKGIRRDFTLEDGLFLDPTLYREFVILDSQYVNGVEIDTTKITDREKAFITLSRNYSSIEKLMYIGDPEIVKFMNNEFGRPFMYNKVLYHKNRAIVRFGSRSGSQSSSFVFELIMPNKLNVEFYYMLSD